MLCEVFQELLRNILRHAKATKVNISIKESSEWFVLKVRDNGIGISHEQKVSPSSLGLLGIKERLRKVGGMLSIQGVKDIGTVCTVSFYMSKQ